MELSEMFSPSELHPAFKRVKGAFIAQEMAGENLLDRTPPSEPTESPGSSEEKTAPPGTASDFSKRTPVTPKESEELTAKTPASTPLPKGQPSSAEGEPAVTPKAPDAETETGTKGPDDDTTTTGAQQGVDEKTQAEEVQQQEQ
ncbi:hypothetical protein COOONC_17269 [Cooperia oncophora]